MQEYDEFEVGPDRVDVSESDQAEYWRARSWLDYAVHELPAGVLWMPDAATGPQCIELMQELDDFAALCRRLGVEDDHQTYITECRWHFEHYPHYLSRSRHIGTYTKYITVRGGPLTVSRPPLSSIGQQTRQPGHD